MNGRLTRALESIGCKRGQDVLTHIRSDGKESWMYVYDAKTEEFIGKIRLEG